MMWISIILFLIVFFILQLVAIFKHYTSDFKIKHSLNLEELCLVVPFKNEKSNLVRFSNWINSQDVLPNEIILVNDHSDDLSIQDLKVLFRDIDLVRFIDLSQEDKGKKAAIRKAIELSNSDYILTMDAYVIPSDRYFETINNLEVRDMNILPVIMTFESSKAFTRFAAYEYNLLHSLNFLLSRYFVLTASGANLLFSKKSFFHSDDIEQHIEIPSGDDHYLLRAFQKNKFEISVINNLQLGVKTKSVKDFGSYWKQRSRWIGKLFKYSKFSDWISGFFITAFILVGFLSLIASLFSGNYIYFALIYGLVTLNYLLPILFFKNTFSFVKFWESIFFVIYYPIVFTLIIFRALFIPNENWK